MCKLICLNLIIIHLFGLPFSYGQSIDNKKYAQFDSLKSIMLKYDENSAILSNLDTQSLLIRAKLMTINKVGVIDEKIIIDDVLKQNAEIFYSENNPGLLYIFITHSQYYYIEHSKSKTVYEFYSVGCTYLVVFNSKDNNFYKLSGFAETELTKFKKALRMKFHKFSSDNRAIYHLIKKSSDCNCEFNEKNRLYIY